MMRVRLVAIGASAGGARAVKELLRHLPADFRAPVVVVLHREEEDTGPSLTDQLRRSTPRPVSEPEDKEPVAAGHVYVAPAGYHLMLEAPGHFALSAARPVLYARPSIDVLFASAVTVYGKDLAGVVLTGQGRDGAEGLRAIRVAGGLAIVQDPATAEHPAMPLASIEAGAVEHVVPLSGVWPLLSDRCAEVNAR